MENRVIPLDVADSSNQETLNKLTPTPPHQAESSKGEPPEGQIRSQLEKKVISELDTQIDSMVATTVKSQSKWKEYFN